ncbi:MAG TPA: hypothetical protein VGZ47_18695 [Gemmataceae bacterium]|jgi:hypothetical protein|nr:hypothetical protein [Gemmataceae bacterium]
MKHLPLFVALLAIMIVCGCKPSRSPGLQVKAVAAADPAPAPGSLPTTPVAENADPFVFPEDWGRKILERTLPPTMAALSHQERAHAPLPRITPAFVERPEISFAMPTFQLPTLTASARKPLRPRPLPEAFPLQAHHEEPQIPQRPELAGGPLSRQRAPNVHEPPPLPTLAKPAANRASLEDPTADFSNEQVIARDLPLRSQPAPFQRVNLPEPFAPKRTTRLVDAEPQVVPPVPMPPK